MKESSHFNDSTEDAFVLCKQEIDSLWRVSGWQGDSAVIKPFIGVYQ